MAFRSLKICILILTFVLPGTALAVMGSSANYRLDIADMTGTAFDATSPSYATTAITDENFNAESSSYVLCGGLPNEVWGCGIVPPPPPPPPPPDEPPPAGGRPETPEEPAPIEPEIPDEPGEEIPDHIIFPWDEFGPGEEPAMPEAGPEPEQIAYVPPGAIVPVDVAPPRGAALEPAEGAWCEQIACYGAAKVLLRPAAPQITYIQQYPVIHYIFALLLIILSALLLLLSHRVRKKRRFYQR